MERKGDPHTCAGCGAAFEVGYDEDLEDAPDTEAEVACPDCGKRKIVCVPEGAVADLAVELTSDEADEGAGDGPIVPRTEYEGSSS